MGKRKEFHISDVLSISHDILVSTRHVEGVYDILNFMTNDNLFTHQLPRAGRECKPWLLRQHPQLANVSSEGIGRDNWEPWLAEQVEKFGEYLTVERIPRDDHSHRDPLAELEDMVGKDRVVVVEGSAPPQGEKP